MTDPTDVLARSIYEQDRYIAGTTKSSPSWEKYKKQDPEGALVEQTLAGVYLSDLAASGCSIGPPNPTKEMMVGLTMMMVGLACLALAAFFSFLAWRLSPWSGC